MADQVRGRGGLGVLLRQVAAFAARDPADVTLTHAPLDLLPADPAPRPAERRGHPRGSVRASGGWLGSPRSPRRVRPRRPAASGPAARPSRRSTSSGARSAPGTASDRPGFRWSPRVSESALCASMKPHTVSVSTSGGPSRREPWPWLFSRSRPSAPVRGCADAIGPVPPAPRPGAALTSVNGVLLGPVSQALGTHTELAGDLGRRPARGRTTRPRPVSTLPSTDCHCCSCYPLLGLLPPGPICPSINLSRPAGKLHLRPAPPLQTPRCPLGTSHRTPRRLVSLACSFICWRRLKKARS